MEGRRVRTDDGFTGVVKEFSHMIRQPPEYGSKYADMIYVYEIEWDDGSGAQRVGHDVLFPLLLPDRRAAIESAPFSAPADPSDPINTIFNK